ncbi:MAG: tRNA (N6-isopentenyl adenosine(37)-C2)-methylthiotransferase MiaB [candidate division WOR-3 bacterium]
MEKKFSIITFGCQMNVRDSETMRSILLKKGFEEDIPENADIILINSCSVRGKAEKRAKIYAREFKRKGKKVIFAGCVAESEKEKIFELGVDAILGTRKIHKISNIAETLIEENKKIIEVGFDEIPEYKDIPEPTHPVTSYVNISIGCDNFCSFCIVPYTRGREISRSYSSILKESQELIDKGSKEIFLLGQNVNSYFDEETGFDFADLIYNLDKDLKGNFWIKYLSPNPRDFSYKVFKSIKESTHISHWFHLPLQSGSTKILKRMKRDYTKEEFLDLCYMIREEFKDSTITTDIIVGFPGEDDKDFEDTLSVVRSVKFEMAFMFKYSERPNTPARRFKDKVPENIKEERLKTLIDEVNRIIGERRKEMLGRRFLVLTEGESEKFENFSKVKTRENIKGIIKGNFKPGEFLIARVIDIKGHTPLFEFERFCNYKGDI